MRTQTFMQQARALGTEVELRIGVENQASADSIFKQLWLKTEKFQNQFSRFLSSSEVSKLNANHGHNTEISESFVRLLKKATELSVLTNGIFNPFCLPLVQKAGYIKSLDSLNPQTPIDYTDRTFDDIKNLKVGVDWAKIPKNSALDLGGIGKGYLADELSNYLDRYGVVNYCLSIGGDLVAKGKTQGQNWSVDVPSAMDNRIIAKYYSNQNKFSVATSGLARSLDGAIQPHLIDPRTRELAKSPFVTCSVASDKCVFADVIASCILIDGISIAKRMLKLNVITGVLLQSKKEADKVILGEGFELMTDKNFTPKQLGIIHA